MTLIFENRIEFFFDLVINYYYSESLYKGVYVILISKSTGFLIIHYLPNDGRL